MSQWQQQPRAPPPAPASPWAAETPDAAPATMVDPYANSGGGSGSASGQAQRGAPLGRAGVRQPAAFQDFRPDELDYMKGLTIKLGALRGLSFTCGAVVAWRFARRRQPPLSYLATGFAAFSSGLAGIFVTSPVGALVVRRDFGRIQDPDHFKKVLRSAAAEVRASRQGATAPQPASVPDPSFGNASSGFAYEDLPAPGGNPTSDGFVRDGAVGGGKSRWEQLREASASPPVGQAGSRPSERGAPQLQQQQGQMR